MYQVVCQREWKLEGLDLATAFLQTAPSAADSQLWTSGVAELREAFQVGPAGIMKIQKNIYGSTTAPRGLWLDLHKTLCSLGARPAVGERCLWPWASETDEDGFPIIIGMMCGHVDDFHTALGIHVLKNGPISASAVTRPTSGELQKLMSIDMLVLTSKSPVIAMATR